MDLLEIRMGLLGTPMADQRQEEMAVCPAATAAYRVEIATTTAEVMVMEEETAMETEAEAIVVVTVVVTAVGRIRTPAT